MKSGGVPARSAEVGSQKSSIVNRLAQSPAHPGEQHFVARGTEQFGRTKRLVSRGPALVEESLVQVHERPNLHPGLCHAAISSDARHTAYVKIAEGCNHPCSFCIIPRMRGSHRSRQQTDILAEAKAFAGGRS